MSFCHSKYESKISHMWYGIYLHMQFSCNSLANISFEVGGIQALLSVQNEKSRSELGMLSDKTSMSGSLTWRNSNSFKGLGQKIARKGPALIVGTWFFWFYILMISCSTISSGAGSCARRLKKAKLNKGPRGGASFSKIEMGATHFIQ